MNTSSFQDLQTHGGESNLWANKQTERERQGSFEDRGKEILEGILFRVLKCTCTFLLHPRPDELPNQLENKAPPKRKLFFKKNKPLYFTSGISVLFSRSRAFFH